MKKESCTTKFLRVSRGKKWWSVMTADFASVGTIHANSFCHWCIPIFVNHTTEIISILSFHILEAPFSLLRHHSLDRTSPHTVAREFLPLLLEVKRYALRSFSVVSWASSWVAAPCSTLEWDVFFDSLCMKDKTALLKNVCHPKFKNSLTHWSKRST